MEVDPSKTSNKPAYNQPSAPREHYKYALMGAIAGTFMESTVHPIDTVRTRIKSNLKEHVSFFDQTKQMYKTEGPICYFRGLSSTLVGASMSQGIYFYIYEKLKYEFNKQKWLPSDVAPFIAGFVGGVVGDLIEIPTDLIRTRMQLEPGHYDYKNVFDATLKIYKNEGFFNLYRGGSLYVALDALDTGLIFGFYEMNKKLFRKFWGIPDNSNPLSLTLVSSSLAAVFTSLITNPLDVVVTRVQMINTANTKPPSLSKLLKRINKHEGIEGFFKGVGGRMGHYAISAILLIPTYEILKDKFGVDLDD
jgi:Mitochondrial carrier protein